MAEKGKRKPRKKMIEVVKGKTNPDILLIAPHGHPRDDEKTGVLVRSIQKILDCPAIINEKFRKPAPLAKKPDELETPNPEKGILDLYQKEQAEKYPPFIRAISKRIKDRESAFVFWFHGIDDDNLAKQATELKRQDGLNCLIGYGQPDRMTCNKAVIMGLIGAFDSVGIKSAETKEDARDYRGWDTDRMNQYFRVSGDGFKGVQSVQLEYGFAGVRDKASVAKTAEKFARALMALNGTVKIVPIEKDADEALVSDTLNHLSSLFNGGYHEAMRLAGDYIIEKFFGGDPQLVIDKRPVLKKSINNLVKKLQEGDDKAPSKSWFYDSYRLAALEQIFKKSGFQIFGNLGHSHKLALLSVKKIEIIMELASEAVEKKYNVAQLKERKNEIKETKLITLNNLHKKEDLRGAELKRLEKLDEQAKKKIEGHKKDLETLKKQLGWITEVIGVMPPDERKTKKSSQSALVVKIENGLKAREAKKAKAA